VHLQRQLQRHGRHHPHEQFAYRRIQCRAADPLANRCRALDARPLTQVGGAQLPAVLVVAHRHAVAARRTDRQALQQGRPFPRGGALLAIRRCVLAQALQVVLVVLPAEVALVGVTDERGPLLLR
jgi:hypothetical protein